eukprot:5337190-Ditylum_brightwellii.AAC.1
MQAIYPTISATYPWFNPLLAYGFVPGIVPVVPAKNSTFVHITNPSIVQPLDPTINAANSGNGSCGLDVGRRKGTIGNSIVTYLCHKSACNTESAFDLNGA